MDPLPTVHKGGVRKLSKVYISDANLINVQIKGFIYENNTKLVTWILQFKSNVILMEEKELYTLSDMFSDIGGYMGLLLGWSIFSIFNDIMNYIQMSFRVIKRT